MSSDDESRKERLAKLLEDGKDWERTETSIGNVSIVRMPEFRGRPPVLTVEINITGGKSYKGGIKIRSAEQLEKLSEIIYNDNLSKLVNAMDEVNPSSQSDKTSSPDSSKSFKV